jgi:predicted RNA-binding Zn-ribbon protein involved in translation (DUF1610 family)
MIGHHASITIDRVSQACHRRNLSLDNPGFCLECGAEVEGVEPDASEYQCEECGEPRVFGAEEILLMLI